MVEKKSFDCKDLIAKRTGQVIRIVSLVYSFYSKTFQKVCISGGAESVRRGNDGAENVRRGSCTGAEVIVRK